MLGVIMAGGEGTRLRPLTCGISKPMVPVLGRPVMEYSIDLLKKHGVNSACVTLAYLPNSVIDHFGDGGDFGIGMEYFIENEPLGTAGSVKNARSFLDETFVVISGDALTDIDLSEVFAFHKEKGSKLTIVLKRVDTPLDYGVVIANTDGKIERFLEKPSWSEVFSDTVNTGIYVIEPEILDMIPEGMAYDFSRDLFPAMMAKGIDIYGYTAQGYWCDIGDAAQYMRSHSDVLDDKVKIDIKAERRGNNVYIQDGAVIENGAEITGPCFIGSGSVIKAGSRIDGYSVIGKGCTISGAGIRRSVLWNCVSVGYGTEIRGGIVCSRVRLGRGCGVYENAIIGDDCIIGNYCEVRPKVRVWPSKVLDEDSVVTKDLVWSEGAKSTIFGDLGISGRINEDITPEFLCSLGAAYASVAGSEIAVGYTDGSAGQMLANAAASGVMSAGVFVHDAEACILPVMRYIVRELNISGAILVESDTGFARVHILDAHGSDINRKTEKKIETAFFRNDGKRCDYREIKYCRDLENASLFYTRALVRKFASVKERPVRVVLGGRNKLRDLAGDILRRLGCEVFYLDDDACDEIAARGISSLQAGIAAVFGNDGEFSLYDETGMRLSESALRMLKYMLVCELGACSTLFLPVNESAQTEDYLKSYRVKVERAKTNAQDLMEKIWASGDTSEQKETYFGIMFDPVEFLLRLIQVMSAQNRSLSELAGSLPDSTVLMTTVQCPAKHKGKVIRALAGRQGRKQFVDGVKIYDDNGWALVLPDNDKPVCRVYTSAFSEEYASELAVKYSDIIKKLTEENG